MPSRSPARPATTPATPATTPATPATPASATGPSGQDPKASPARTTLKIGDPAPAFDLPGDDGKRHTLAALKGQRFVIYFYPRDSTPGCTTEACDFRDRHAALLAAGVQLFGVSGDDLKSHTKFRSKHALAFPLLSDQGNELARAFGVFGDKTLYGRVSQGIIRSTFLVGPSGRIEAAWSPVKVNGHAEAVLQTVLGAAA
jgi:thioredoxin-dependent peroxiredoxin